MTEQARESMTSKTAASLIIFLCVWPNWIQRSVILCNGPLSCLIAVALTLPTLKEPSKTNISFSRQAARHFCCWCYSAAHVNEQISLLIPVCVIFRVCLGITADVPQYIITTFGLWPVHVMLNHYLHFCLSTCETAPALNTDLPTDWQQM